MAIDAGSADDRELALWLLKRMENSEELLADVRAGRASGKRYVLDRPEFVEEHRARLKALYEDADGDDEEVPVEVAALLDAVAERDARSGAAEIIEKALAALLEQRPELAAGSADFSPTTVAMARAEVEGRTQGNFGANFVAGLAAEARRQLEAERAREERDREANERD